MLFIVNLIIYYTLLLDVNKLEITSWPGTSKYLIVVIEARWLISLSLYSNRFIYDYVLDK